LFRSNLTALAWIASALALPPSARAQNVTIEIEDEPPAPVVDENAALREEIAALRARLDALEAAQAARVEAAVEAAPAVEAVETTAVETTEPAPEAGPLDVLRDLGLSISGYVQAQYEWSDLSEDELLQGGVVMNRDRFSIRRGRLRIAGEWDHFALELELDGNTTRGAFFGLRRTTVGVLWRNEDRALPPYLDLRVGLTEIPFGHEVRQGQRDWLFMERSLGSLSFFRGPLDTGVRANGGIGPFRYDVAVMGGTPLDDRAGQGFALDPTSAPDVVGRLGAQMDESPDFELGGGVSFLWGTGFHPGEDAQKGRLEWRDLNESGTFDTGELIAIPGRAATPSLTFERWAFNADASAGFRSPIGWTRVFVEATIASNLDRSFFVADPIALGADVRETSAYVALTQDIFEWGFVGFRYDYYDPNSDLIDQRRGISIPADAAIHSFSPLVGLRLPGALVPGFGARIAFQYDAILDALGRDERGVPADLRNDQFTIRVQGEFR
jgi:hypothetical protein